MKDNNINLLDAKADEPVMPTISDGLSEQYDKLRSDDVKGALLGETVKTLILPEDSKILDKNFIFDFSDKDIITIFQKDVLKSLVSDTGTVGLYLYGKHGLVLFGLGEQYQLESLLPLIHKYVFANEITIYKDFQPGDLKPKVVDAKNIANMRIHL